MLESSKYTRYVTNLIKIWRRNQVLPSYVCPIIKFFKSATSTSTLLAALLTLASPTPSTAQAVKQQPPLSSPFHPTPTPAPSTPAPLTSEQKDNILLSACAHGDVDLLTKALDEGADANARDPKGTSALIYAMVSKRRLGIVSLLLQKNADPNGTDRNGKPALLWAIEAHDDALVDMLIKAGANTNGHDRKGNTAFFVALATHNHHALQVLLGHGVKQICNSNENAPLSKVSGVEIAIRLGDVVVLWFFFFV